MVLSFQDGMGGLTFKLQDLPDIYLLQIFPVIFLPVPYQKPCTVEVLIAIYGWNHIKKSMMDSSQTTLLMSSTNLSTSNYVINITSKRCLPCVFLLVKKTNGVPTRAKSQIVALDNFDPRPWSKSDCFSPVVSIPMVRLLTTLAVQNKRTVKQGDCKFAFIQASLPDNELTIIKPPIGCPCSGVRKYWRLKKITIWPSLCSSSLAQIVF